MNIDPEDLRQLGAAATGSGIAAYIAKAKGMPLLAMFAGGMLTSIMVGPSIASLANLSDHQSGVGFTVGFLAIMILRKIHEVVEGIPAKGVGGLIVRFFQRLLGIPPGEATERTDEK